MADITIQTTTRDGIAPTYGALSDDGPGDEFVNDGRTVVYLKNTSGAPIDVTFTSYVKDNYGNTNNHVVTVPATTGERIVGPFNPSRFNLNDRTKMTYDTNPPTGLTAAVLRLGDPG